MGFDEHMVGIDAFFVFGSFATIVILGIVMLDFDGMVLRGYQLLLGGCL